MSHNPLHPFIVPYLVSFHSTLLSVTYFLPPSLFFFALRSLSTHILHPSAISSTSCHSALNIVFHSLLSLVTQRIPLPLIIHYFVSFIRASYSLHIILHSRYFSFRNVLFLPHSWQLRGTVFSIILYP